MSIACADDAPCSAPILLHGSIVTNLERAALLGYQAIEIHMRNNEALDYQRINAVCRDTGMRISAVVTGRLATQENVAFTDQKLESARRAIHGLKQYIDMAEQLESDIIIGWIRGKLNGRSRDEYLNCAGRVLRELEQYAKVRGVRLLIEAINRYELDTLNTADDIMKLISSQGLVNTYVHLDTFHMNIEESNVAQAIDRCGTRLGYVHLADSNRQYPSQGHFDFLDVLHALDRNGYNGYLSVECLPLPDSETAAEQALIVVNQMMGVHA